MFGFGMIVIAAVGAALLQTSAAAVQHRDLAKGDEPRVSKFRHVTWPAGYERIISELGLPPAEALDEGVVRELSLSGRSQKGHLTELAVLPDGVRVRALRIDFVQQVKESADMRVETSYRATSRRQALVDVAAFDGIRAPLINRILPPAELDPPLPRRPGFERGCSGHVYSAVEFRFHHPTDYHVVRYSTCGADPLVQGAAMIESAVDTALKSRP